METTQVNHQTHLDGTIKLLTGDIIESATRSGLDNQFQRWIEEIKNQNNPAFHELVVDLQALKAHFGSGTLDVEVISDLLARLGRNTLQASHFAEGNTAPRVVKLGEVLTGVANQLRNGAPAPDGNLPQDFSSHK